MRIVDGALVDDEEKKRMYFESQGMICLSRTQFLKDLTLKLFKLASDDSRREEYKALYEDQRAFNIKYSQLRTRLGDNLEFIDGDKILVDQNGMFIIIV